MASGFSAKRVKESYPVILAFEKWMKDTYPTVLPKTAFVVPQPVIVVICFQNF